MLHDKSSSLNLIKKTCLFALANLLNFSGSLWADEIYFIHSDHLNRPEVVTDKNGKVVWKGEYTPFGEVKEVVKLIEQPLRAPGQYHDTETGLDYNMARDYDSSTGRYIQSDPIGLGGGLNTYAYAGGNPISYTDFFGLYTEIIIWQPIGWTESSFGHVSGNINGDNYSFGPHGWDTKYPRAEDYAARQREFRNGVGVSLKLTPDQEDKLAACLKLSHEEYSFIDNNCGSPFNDCLKRVGVDIGNSTLPVNVGDSLLNSRNFDGVVFYQGPTRGFFENGFWAR